MEEAESDIELDLVNLNNLIMILPKTVKALKSTIEQMTASAGPGDDFGEKKEQLAEQLEELDEIQLQVDKYDDNLNVLKEHRDKLKKQKGKSADFGTL